MKYRKITGALARILVLCMIAALLTPAALADGGSVTASYLNVRSEPSSSATLVGVLSKGSTVTITERLDGWYKIESNGLTGYVSAEYISTGGSSGSSSSGGSSASGSASISAYGVNIRSGPSTSSSIVANVGKGTSVTVTGTEGDWYKIEYKGQSAYVHRDYVTLSGSSSSSSGSASASGQSGTINATYVRLRSGASLGASILRVLDKGATMTITGESGDWYKVNCGGTEGYVYKTYLTVGGSSSSGGSDSSNGDSGQSGTINATYVRFRSGPSTSSSILRTFDKGAGVSVTGTEGDWYKVRYGGADGYVYKTYVTVGSSGSDSGSSANVESASGTGTIRGSYVRVRSGPSTSSSILATVHTGTTMSITGTTGEWYQVSYNGQTGYVYKSYLVDSATAGDSGSGGSTSAGEAIVAKAKEYLGVPYVYGGTSPSGFDCSGLVYYVYKQLGYSVYRTASAQYRNGTGVERSALQPGDIIIFYNGGMSAIGHAGLYIGNNQFIHASSGGGKVQINSLSESYYNTHYYGARRIVS